MLTGVPFSVFSILWQVTTSVWTISRMLLGLFLKVLPITSLQNFRIFSSVLTLVRAAFSIMVCWFAPCCWWPRWYLVCTASLGEQLKWTVPTWCIWLIIWDLQPQKRKTEGHRHAVSALVDTYTSFVVEIPATSLKDYLGDLYFVSTILLDYFFPNYNSGIHLKIVIADKNKSPN